MTKQIEVNKYEPTRIDTLLHNTRAYSPDGWRELSKSLIELSDDDRLLIEYAPLLLAEVKRLREQEKKILQLAEINMALEWGDANHCFEWGYIVDMIKGWTE